MEYIKLSKLKPHRDNPRKISHKEMVKLSESIKANPEYFEARPIICDADYVIWAGNSRYKAASYLKLDKVPVHIMHLPEEKMKEIMIRDNVNNGEWDVTILADDWDIDLLVDYGLEFSGYDREDVEVEIAEAFRPSVDETRSMESDIVRRKEMSRDDFEDEDTYYEDDEDDLEDEEYKHYEEEKGNKEDKEDFYKSMLNDVIYESNNKYEIPTLLLSEQAGKLEMPFAAWGSVSRLRTDVATYCFYVDDYRFEAIWKNPIKVLSENLKALVEPNLSLYDTTPLAYGLHQIYKKRWISRYFQECGIKIYADLNVSQKFYEYNKMGIPKGYNAFFTRGYTDRLEALEKEHAIAKEISGLDNPNFIVYGGGAKVKDYCVKNNLLYVEQFINSKNNG